jgi:indole-3-glycerol phosphate synthase
MNILETIVKYKRAEVKHRKSLMSISTLETFPFFSRDTLSLKTSLLDRSGTGIIAEFKRKSPSKGVINDEADVFGVTRGYAQHGASALSVLTDEHFFGGGFEDMFAAKNNHVPVLQKDFIVDLYQLTEAKAHGADAILLIAACLTPAEVKELAGRAKELGLEVLLEIHEEEELDHICEDTGIIGINNRNLKDFKVDMERSLALAEKIPAGKLRVAESGIDSVETIALFRQKGFDGFLIGEHFMKQPDPAMAFSEFISLLKKHYAP